ncbi:MAG: B12-binding domain-containing radical SAM protein [bacterium]
MNIKLIYPTHNFVDKRKITDYNNSGRRKSVLPPLNIALLAALTPKRHKVMLVDENIEEDNYNENNSLDLVGITSMTGTAPRMYELADRYRARGVKVVLGGSHVSALPNEALTHADAVVVGEADNIWEKVLDDFERGEHRKIYNQDENSSIEKLPFPRYDLLPEGGYYLPKTFQTSRGCPYNCAFCTVTKIFGDKYHHRPIEEVVREIKGMPGQNVVIFTDDNIMADRRRAKELFKALRELKIIWGSQASINSARDEELLRFASESGCRGLFVGIESISKESLREANKSGVNRPDEYIRLLGNFRKYEIKILGSFVFGFDSDERDVFYKTVKFAVNSKLDLAQFSVLTPFPGTEIYNKFKKEGRLIDRSWRHFYQGEVCFEPERMSAQELQRGQQYAWRKFYTINNTLKRLARYGKYIPIYWLANFVFSRTNLSNASPLVKMVTWTWKIFDKKLNMDKLPVDKV